MNPIISPWLIYFINILGDLQSLAILLAGVFLIALMIIFLLWTYYGDIGVEFEYVKKGKHKIIIFFEVISILGIIFIPSKETIYAMVVAKYVTPNNIEMVGGSVKNSIDYIFEKIDTLTEEEEEK